MTRILPLIFTSLILFACGEAPASRGSAGMSGTVVSSGTAKLGGPYTLINQDEETVTEADFLGRPQLVYFGFGYCPDICPIALQKLGAVQEKIDPEGTDLNYVFITIDPERDTPESLALYVTANGFPKTLVGLTGPQEKIDIAKTAYRVYGEKAFDPESAGEYTMNHSDIIYFMGNDGKFVDIFTGRSTVDDIAAGVRQYQKAAK